MEFGGLYEDISLAFILHDDGAVLQLQQHAVHGNRKPGRGVFVESDLIRRQQLKHCAAGCRRRNGVAIINPAAARKWLPVLPRYRRADDVSNYRATLLCLPGKSRSRWRYLGEEPLSYCVAFTRARFGD